MSTRYKGERPPKRQLSPSPPPPPPALRRSPQVQRRAKAKSPSPAESDHALPSNLRSGQALPTLDQPQPTDLPEVQYKSIAERQVRPRNELGLD